VFDPFLTGEPPDDALLAVGATAPPAPPTPEHIGDLIAGAMRRAAESFLAHDRDETDADRDAEDLHASRVALRRIRSLLRTFRSLVEPEWVSAARADMGWFSQLLGEVRNLDVLALRIALHTESDVDPLALESLYGAVALQRSDVTFRVASARAMPRYESVLRQIDRLVTSEPPLTARAGEGSREALPRLLRRPWRNVREAARRAHESPTEPNLHALRIRSKELRYASELATAVFGQRAAELATTATAIQDRLGDHRDALAAAAFLTATAGERFECAFLAGQLVVIERLDAVRLLHGLGKDLAALKKSAKAFERSAAKDRPLESGPATGPSISMEN
jgi:CHAD domain-containing protein